MLSAVFAAAAASAAIGVNLLEEANQALMQGDECQSSDAGDSACALSALQVHTASHSRQTAETECASVGQPCSDTSPKKPCCGDNDRCLLNGTAFKCLPQEVGPATQDYCVAAWQWCGGRVAQKRCCDINDHCRRDGNVFKCKPLTDLLPASSGPCMAEGQWCGTHFAQRCCVGRNDCVREGDDTDYRCKPNMCRTKGEICGGLDQRRHTCCSSDQKCLLQPGDGNIFKCDVPCVVEWGQVCGGGGHRQCACSTGTCKLVWWNIFSQTERCL